jgi:hypothetical protein
MTAGDVGGRVVDVEGVATGDVAGRLVDVVADDDEACDAVPPGLDPLAAIWVDREPVPAFDADVPTTTVECVVGSAETEEVVVPDTLETVAPGCTASPPSEMISLLVAWMD